MDAQIVAQEAFAVSTLDAAQSHEEWLTAARCMLLFLLDNDQLLLQLIGREADREIVRHGAGESQAEAMRVIFDELGLKLVMHRRYV